MNLAILSAWKASYFQLADFVLTMPELPEEKRLEILRRYAPIFSSDGDVGDLFYSLATVKQLGGGRLRLYKASVREPFTPAKVEKLRPLLERQPYINSVEYGEGPAGIDLRYWRSHYKNWLNICDMVSEAFAVPHYPRNEPWLFCNDPLHIADVVIHRSERYHGPFCWKKIAEKYAGRMAFVGMPEEHRRWEKEYGQVPYHPTPDWLALARVISGAKVFCGNQSGPMALALALCKTMIVQERSLYVGNCHFNRTGCYYGDCDPPDLNP